MCYIFSTALVPKYEEGYETGVYGAIGNDATCTSQGFFFQLGLVGGTLYNFMLSVYYVFVIVEGYRESQVKSLRKWFHIPCIAVSLGLACAGLPFYQNLVIFLSHCRSTIGTQLCSNDCLYPCSHLRGLVWMLFQYGTGVLGCQETKSGGPEMAHTAKCRRLPRPLGIWLWRQECELLA